MPQTIHALALASTLLRHGVNPALSAEREQVRMVINLVSGAKIPYPENLRNNLARTERVQLDTNGATVACLRLDDKIRWRDEHIAPVGARAETLRIRNEPIAGLLVGQLYHYVTDFDLDGPSTSGAQPGSTVNRTLRSEWSVIFPSRDQSRRQFRGDYQKLYDEGIQVALKYLGE